MSFAFRKQYMNSKGVSFLIFSPYSLSYRYVNGLYETLDDELIFFLRPFLHHESYHSCILTYQRRIADDSQSDDEECNGLNFDPTSRVFSHGTKPLTNRI
jgi:hypothetical protein